ncbi:MAG: tetratricopeptide repeat protein, partial [Polaromonas sp.]|nr:tetratricopeptide repeat protein [Polaromonas sp.]
KFIKRILNHRLEIKKTLAISTFFSIFHVIPAFSEESSEVAKLLHAGQLEAAMERAEDFLSRQPHDAQMRFVKGLILTEKHKVADAISIFTGLSEDFPDSPEPFNNLAVLLAGNGDFEKARVALDAAIRTHPTYATAYQNMNHVRASLTGAANHQSLPLDSSNTSAKSKLALLWSLELTAPKLDKTRLALAVTAPSMAVIGQTILPGVPVAKASASPGSDAGSQAPTPGRTANQQPVKVEPKPEKLANNENTVREQVPNVVKGWSKALSDENLADVRVKLEGQDDGEAPPVKPHYSEGNNFDASTIPAPPPAPLASEAISPAPTFAATEKQPLDKADLRPERSAGNEEANRDQILNAVRGWSEAWSGHDVENYLSYYGNDFQTPDKEPLTAWAHKRRTRILAQSRISIEVASPQVTINGNTAIIKFRQIYSSDQLKSNIYKTLTFTKNKEIWKIWKEQADN